MNWGSSFTEKVCGVGNYTNNTMYFPFFGPNCSGAKVGAKNN